MFPCRSAELRRCHGNTHRVPDNGGTAALTGRMAFHTVKHVQRACCHGAVIGGESRFENPNVVICNDLSQQSDVCRLCAKYYVSFCCWRRMWLERLLLFSICFVFICTLALMDHIDNCPIYWLHLVTTSKLSTVSSQFNVFYLHCRRMQLQ